MNFKYLLLLFIPLTALLAACGGGGSSGGSDMQDSVARPKTEAEIVDSIVTRKDSAADKPKIHFEDAATARRWMNASANSDKYNSGILPRMADESLKYVENIVNSDSPNFIIVDKGSMRVYLYDRYGRAIQNWGMACARNYGNKKKKGDCRTPEGYYVNDGIFESSTWPYINDQGVRAGGPGTYGPRFIRVKHAKFPGAVGIHGTSAPGSIGRRCSHGCIRMKNADVLELAAQISKGVPIIINPGPRDMAVNEKEDTPVPVVSVTPDGRLPEPEELAEPKKDEKKE